MGSFVHNATVCGLLLEVWEQQPRDRKLNEQILEHSPGKPFLESIVGPCPSSQQQFKRQACGQQKAI